MTDQLKQQTELIAKYDGFKAPPKGCTNPAWINRAMKKHFEPKDLVNYHTSDTWLMPVARKVWQELSDILLSQLKPSRDKDILSMLEDLEHSAFQSTAELFNDTYHGIILLQELKQTK